MRVVDALFEATQIQDGIEVISDIQNNIFENAVRFIDAETNGLSITLAYKGKLLDNTETTETIGTIGTIGHKNNEMKFQIYPVFGLEEIKIISVIFQSNLVVDKIKDYLKEKLLTKYEF